MKRYRFFAATFFFGCVALGFIGQGRASESVTHQPGAIKVLSGEYRGEISDEKGTRFAFVLVINQLETGGIGGTIFFYTGIASCRSLVPVSGFVDANGMIRVDVTKNVIPGCERSLVLRSTNPQKLTGVLNGAYGQYQVTLTKR